jgi:hypothetical protein
MLLTKLKREAIVKSDFSTFGYKFSLENKDEYPHNEAASVISTLIEFDVRKLTHGFLTFVPGDRVGRLEEHPAFWGVRCTATFIDP